MHKMLDDRSFLRRMEQGLDLAVAGPHLARIASELSSMQIFVQPFLKFRGQRPQRALLIMMMRLRDRSWRRLFRLHVAQYIIILFPIGIGRLAYRRSALHTVGQ